MTYDIYCYKSILFAPDLNEAQHVALMKDQEKDSIANSDKFKILIALRKFNPELDSYTMPGYNKLKTTKRVTNSHVVLNSPRGEFATQITILNNRVLFSIPYWYSERMAHDVFIQTREYLKVIRQAVCYYVYDPQAQKAYDPWNENFDALPLYAKISGIIEQDKLDQAEQKCWWKF